MDGWNTTFLLGRPIFRGYVSFREGKWHTPIPQLAGKSYHLYTTEKVLALPGGWTMLPIPPFRGTRFPTIEEKFITMGTITYHRKRHGFESTGPGGEVGYVWTRSDPYWDVLRRYLGSMD